MADGGYNITYIRKWKCRIWVSIDYIGDRHRLYVTDGRRKGCYKDGGHSAPPPSLVKDGGYRRYFRGGGPRLSDSDSVIDEGYKGCYKGGEVERDVIRVIRGVRLKEML